MNKEQLLDKMDAEIMEWFYETVRINFSVDGMVQDSTELREIIIDNLVLLTEKPKESNAFSERE